MKVSIPLNIPDVEVIKVETINGDLVITVESTLQGTNCTRCGRPIIIVWPDGREERIGPAADGA